MARRQLGHRKLVHQLVIEHEQQEQPTVEPGSTSGATSFSALRWKPVPQPVATHEQQDQ